MPHVVGKALAATSRDTGGRASGTSRSGARVPVVVAIWSSCGSG